MALAPDPDGLVVFPVQGDGTLGAAKFHDAKAGSPFYIAFLNGQPDTFVIGFAVGDGCAMATIDGDGKINVELSRPAFCPPASDSVTILWL